MEKQIKITGENIAISDGYHTFDELYEHRITLFISLCRQLYKHYGSEKTPPLWKSKLHADGSAYDGWFILGIGYLPGHQISYHLPLSKWEQTDFVPILAKAPEWDGHTSDDVLNRLRIL